MVLSFTGEHSVKLDGKGRMTIPADFRRVLEAGDPTWAPGQSPQFYMLYGNHLIDVLQVYTVDEFNALANQIKALPRGSDKRKKLSRLIIGQSVKLDVDKDGRTGLPLAQRQKLGVTEGMLKFSGLADYFEIWKDEDYTKKVGSELDDWLEEQDAGFDVLSLLDE